MKIGPLDQIGHKHKQQNDTENNREDLENLREGDNDKSLELSLNDVREDIASNSTINEEQKNEVRPAKTDEYTTPQTYCFEQCDLVLYRKSEYAKRIMNHYNEGD